MLLVVVLGAIARRKVVKVGAAHPELRLRLGVACLVGEPRAAAECSACRAGGDDRAPASHADHKPRTSRLMASILVPRLLDQLSV